MPIHKFAKYDSEFYGEGWEVVAETQKTTSAGAPPFVARNPVVAAYIGRFARFAVEVTNWGPGNLIQVELHRGLRGAATFFPIWIVPASGTRTHMLHADPIGFPQVDPSGFIDLFWTSDLASTVFDVLVYGQKS